MFLNNVQMCFLLPQWTEETQEFLYYQIIACHLDIILLGQVTGVDWQAGLEVRINSTGLSLFLILEQRS